MIFFFGFGLVPLVDTQELEDQVGDLRAEGRKKDKQLEETRKALDWAMSQLRTLEDKGLVLVEEEDTGLALCDEGALTVLPETPDTELRPLQYAAVLGMTGAMTPPAVAIAVTYALTWWEFGEALVVFGGMLAMIYMLLLACLYVKD